MRLFFVIITLCTLILISCSSKIVEQKKAASNQSKVIRFDTINSNYTKSMPVISGRIFEYPSMSEAPAKILIFNAIYQYETATLFFDNSYRISLPRPGRYTIKYSCLGYKELIMEDVNLLPGKTYIIDIGFVSTP